MKLSDTLKHAIEHSDWSVNALAKSAGIQQASLQRFVAGKRTLSQKNIERLCAFLGLELMQENLEQ